MTRPIKFRAYCPVSCYRLTQNGWTGKDIMCSVSMINPIKGTLRANFKNFGNENSFQNFKISEVNLMQFTGLLDKNGKEIYEGDILKFRTKENNFVKVYFDDGGFKMKVGNIISALIYFLGKYQCEIIGNIYENTDLLSNK